MKFLKMSQLDALMAEFSKRGPAQEKVRADVDMSMENDDEISPREYDYLLSMPMWSVTEERVEALIKQMNDKKEYKNSSSIENGPANIPVNL